MDNPLHPGAKSFFQDPQKLTFAFGLSSGLAVMAIIGFIVVAVQRNEAGGLSGGSSADTNTAVANDQQAAPLLDPTTVASAIGLDAEKFTSCLNSGKYVQRISADENEGTTAGVEGTPTTFVNGTVISGAQPYTNIKATIDAALAGTKGTAAVPPLRDSDHVRGKKDAKVLMIEYTDFECPFCQRFHPTTKQALTEYGDQVAHVIRHYPLRSIHPSAQKLAEGAECAAELGGNEAFWNYADAVFQG